MAAVAGSNIVVFKTTASSAKFGDRKIGQFRQWSPVPVNFQPRPCAELKRRWSSSFASSGIKAQVATIKQATTEAAQNVEAPVAVVTGASRGIGRAVALSLGKAGCKVNELLIRSGLSHVHTCRQSVVVREVTKVNSLLCDKAMKPANLGCLEPSIQYLEAFHGRSR